MLRRAPIPMYTLGLLAVAYTAAEPAPAHATIIPITYCVSIQFLSDFQDCPSQDNGSRWPLTCSSSAYRNLNGLVVDLFDKDNSGGDDYISTHKLSYSGATGEVCISTTWDTNREAVPDVYPEFRWVVQDNNSSTSRFSQVCDAVSTSSTSCTAEHVLNLRDFAVTDCSFCSLSVGVSSSATSNNTKRAMIAFAAQRFEDAFSSASGRTHNILFSFDDTTCSGNCNSNRWINRSNTDNNAHRRWDSQAHESGHALQRQLWEDDDSPSNGTCPPSHYLEVMEPETCATSEGWATFVSMVSWWDPNNVDSRPNLFGFQIETDACFFCSCSHDSDTELAVIRTFWDLDDQHDDGIDTRGVSTNSILQTWDAFPAGTANHDEDEPGDFAHNLWDFYANASSTVKSVHLDAMSRNYATCQTN